MNYIKIYSSIISRALTRKLEGYGEVHHILPKCLGGTNKPENLVKLTAKEHYVVHHLLTKIHPNNNKITYAYWSMCSLRNKYTNERYKISARTYEKARIAMSKATKERLAFYNYWEGKTHSEESKKKMSKSAKVRNISTEMEKKRREGISNSNKGKSKSIEHSKNISKAKKGSKNPRYGKPSPQAKIIEQYSLEGEFIKEWESISLAAKELKCTVTTLSNCANGKTKKSKGYIWKWKIE